MAQALYLGLCWRFVRPNMPRKAMKAATVVFSLALVLSAVTGCDSQSTSQQASEPGKPASAAEASKPEAAPAPRIAHGIAEVGYRFENGKPRVSEAQILRSDGSACIVVQGDQIPGKIAVGTIDVHEFDRLAQSIIDSGYPNLNRQDLEKLCARSSTDPNDASLSIVLNDKRSWVNIPEDASSCPGASIWKRFLESAKTVKWSAPADQEAVKKDCGFK